MKFNIKIILGTVGPGQEGLKRGENVSETWVVGLDS